MYEKKEWREYTGKRGEGILQNNRDNKEFMQE